jgi:hypothetical protein
MSIKNSFSAAFLTIFAFGTAFLPNSNAITVDDTFYIQPSMLDTSASVNVTFSISGNGSVSGIQWVNQAIELPSFSIGINPGTAPSNDAEGYWTITNQTRNSANISAVSNWTKSISGEVTGTTINARDTIYKSGAFSPGSFSVTVPEGGAYHYPSISKAYINMQVVQAPGTSTTISVSGTLSGTISLQNSIAGTTTYEYVRYDSIPEPMTTGLWMAAASLFFCFFRRSRHSGSREQRVFGIKAG